MKGVHGISDFDFSDKRVIVRVDYNITSDESGKLKSDKRILISLKTVKHLLDNGARQLILMTHIGRPKGRERGLQTDNVARRLSELINVPVKKLDDFGEDGVPDGKIVFLENLRFHPGEKSKDEAQRAEFGRHLASLADVYVNEAFSNCHRAHASMVEVPRHIPGCMGFGVQTEIETISGALRHPEKPFISIIGGAKADKVNAIKNLLVKADCILMGGALAVLFHKMKGLEVGSTKIDEEGLKDVPAEIVDDPKIILPVDYVIADSFSGDANTKTVAADAIEEGWQALDIGPKTIDVFKERLIGAKTVIWNGPLGVFEIDKFAVGTKEIAKCIGDIDAVTIVGGGDSASAIEKAKLADKMTLVSTGGGASLTMFEGKELPAIKALQENYLNFKE